MRRSIALMIILLLAFWLPTLDAQAKRFGGGRSFGMQRNVSSYSRQPFQSLQGAAAQTAKRSFASKWLAPLAGLAVGGLLATLFMQNGLGSGLLIWVAILLGILLIANLFRRRVQPNNTPVYQQAFTEAFPREEEKKSHAFSPNSSSFLTSASQDYPADFDANSFLREAKVQFIRLQAAYDNKNLNDLREFTTPEIFAEIQLQLHERGNEPNQTVVDQLDAELLDVSVDSSFMSSINEKRRVASVKFTGKLHETPDEEVSLNETWHFIKESTNTRWLVAGIEQH